MASQLAQKRLATPTSRLPSKRIKTPNAIDALLVLKLLNDPEVSAEEAIARVTHQLNHALALEQVPQRKVLQSSTVELADVTNLLGVHYIPYDSKHVWNIRALNESRRGTSWLDTVLGEMKANHGWGLETCEALGRTLVDLILFDRMQLITESTSPYRLRLVGEYTIVTGTTEPGTFMSGCCDAVIGYGGHRGKKDLLFGLVAIEIKKRYTLCPISPQLIAYLIGLQQKRKEAGKMVSVVYGIATDGDSFLFYHLNAELHLKAQFLTAQDTALAYRYIDVILESAIRSTPNISPSFKQPATSRQFSHVEKLIWNHSIPDALAILDADDYEYLIVEGEDGNLVSQRTVDEMDDQPADPETSTTPIII